MTYQVPIYSEHNVIISKALLIRKMDPSSTTLIDPKCFQKYCFGFLRFIIIDNIPHSVSLVEAKPLSENVLGQL